MRNTLAGMLMLLAATVTTGQAAEDAVLNKGKPSEVTIVANAGGGWQLSVNGKPFVIHGAGGGSTPGLLEKLKAAGGNCVRTWGIDDLEAKVSDGKRYIDLAHELGIMVVPGMWIGHERHGFDYGDAARVQKQRDEVIAAVRKYKNHPAVLMWGIGNEMEGPTSAAGSVAVFKEIEELAKLVKQEDPQHPVMTVIAYNPAKTPNIIQHCPSIDVLGINSYGAASGAGEGLKKAGWTKPFAVTEFGVSGPWEVGKTAWGAPYEPTSQEKARTFYATHRLVTDMNDGKELCLGTFAFVWGTKQERTATWFGLFLPTKEKLPQVDALTKAWTGSWPTNRCPKIDELSAAFSGTVVRPGKALTASIIVSDPDGDAMTYRWELLAESEAVSVGGDHEDAASSFPEFITDGGGATCTLTSPIMPGNYRLFVTVFDGNDNAATANCPFRVAP